MKNKFFIESFKCVNVNNISINISIDLIYSQYFMTENNLVLPIVCYLCDGLKYRSKVLVYQEATLRNWNRVDLVIVTATPEYEGCLITAVELESTLKRAIYDPNHGIYQLEKYVGNKLYLGIPANEFCKEVRNKCEERGYGLLAVHGDGKVEELQKPSFMDCDLHNYKDVFYRF
ncbi:hypothetical protein DRN72_02945 [Methanosarcinales archaeon]|nr:MAG: hypothetical protein DRN72_02945 [Methanosarcinales archaeon]